MKNPRKVTLRTFLPYLASLLLVVIVSVPAAFVKGKVDSSNIVIFYLLIVVVAAVYWGRGPAILVSVLSVLVFDYFLVPPYLSFAVSDYQYLFTFAGLLIVGLVISALATKTREQTKEKNEQELKLEMVKQNEKLQTALLNSISHDLRTPLVSITGSISSLLSDPGVTGKAENKELLEMAFEESTRLNQLVSNLLDMTRLEAGTLKLRRNPCELRDLVGSSLNALKYKTEGRDIRVNIPDDLPEIELDFTLMMRVFINLIDNAVKYSAPASKIEVSAFSTQDTMIITVKDEGFGIPFEDRERIFQKFYRAVKPRQVSGTGLGLSICKGITEAHGGSIAAKNNPDRGISVTVSLPFAKKTRGANGK